MSEMISPPPDRPRFDGLDGAGWPWSEENVPAVMNVLFGISVDLARTLPLVESQNKAPIEAALLGLDEVIAAFVAQRRVVVPVTGQ